MQNGGPPGFDPTGAAEAGVSDDTSVWGDNEPQLLNDLK
jgi:hypothetical protein